MTQTTARHMISPWKALEYLDPKSILLVTRFTETEKDGCVILFGSIYLINSVTSSSGPSLKNAPLLSPVPNLDQLSFLSRYLNKATTSFT